MDFHLYFPLLLIFHIFVYHKGAALDSKTDREALLSLKFEIADPKNSLSNWNTTTSHCTWSGVSCTATNRVRSINLTGFGLLGTLSPHLSNLTSLQIINLSKNLFYGQIPPGFAHLSLLEHFILSENSLTGTIPGTLSHCHNLRVVSLSFNNLTGHLPPELGSLTRLKILNASGNNLTGVIPPTFGNLSALSVLSLARNELYGTIPDKLGDHLHSLLIIQLSENHFSGEFPRSVLNISSLVYLSVTQNNFTGKLPDDLGFSLPNIEKLYLAQNRFGGSISDSLSNASRIQDLDLSSNQFQGPILSLTNMEKLVNLNLGANSLSSTTELNFQLFESLKNCTKLQSLILNSNQLAGELPISLANLSADLTDFCVDSNHFTGNFPRGIGNYQNLISVAIQENSFTGQIPQSIGALHKLQRMTLNANMFSGEIPDMFANLTRLYQLTLGSNQFSGKIPISIGRCHHLGTLGLANNNLVGGVPKEIFGLYDLNFLNLARNALNDSLPSELGSLKQLEFFAVSENHLSGDLLQTIHSCASMRYLYAARNNFSGSIPKSLGDLIALESLDLSSNHFSGPIPKELENLRVLQELNVSFNDFEGQIPRNGVFINLGWDSFVGNSKLCGNDQEDATRLRIPNCIVKKKKSFHLAPKTIIIIVISSVVVICAVFGLIWAFFSWRMKRKMQSGRDISSPSLKGLPPKISYSDIHQATNGFSADNLIGKGTFGSVYKGVFGIGDSGVYTTLAIKVLDLNQSRALKSFNAECEALRNVRHRNLVRVITSCSSIDHGGGEFKALVMELMSNGNLENWVHPKEFASGSNLSLTQRLDIAIDVASAMDYLHHDCEPPVVHCDLKPSNVLLDDNMRAHVGDFGLARFLHPVLTENNSSSTMGLKGSIGYIAPEYGLGSNVSTKGDVYSFGILLLEIFTARKPTDEMFKDGLNLNKFVSEVMLQQNQVLKMVDAIRHFNNNDYSSENNTATSISSSFGYSRGEISNVTTSWDSKIEQCVAALMRTGLCCAADSPGERLTMRETLTKLHKIKRNLLE